MVPQPQPSPLRGRLLLRRLAPILTIVLLASTVRAQPGPRILHDELKCVLAGEYLVLQAFIEPADGLITVKAYFRANIYSLFYYVEMTREGDLFQGVLPKASNEITGLHYYLEAVDESYNSVRTAEYTPQVVTSESSCRESNPTPAVYLDGPGAITVGATGPGPGIPAGFLPEGIVGTITAAGRAASGGGGSALLIGAAAAGGAAAGIGILAAGSDDNTTTTTVSGTGGGGTTSISTTTIPPATTSIPSTMVDACFETSPSPPTIPVGGAVRFDASCSVPERELIASYMWRFNDGRGDREGRVVNRTYPTAGVFRADLTVTDINGVSDTTSMDVTVDEALPPPPGGGGGSGKTVRISKSGPGSVSSGANFSYSITVTNTGTTAATGVQMVDPLPGGLTLVNVTFTASADNCSSGNPVICNAANLAPGASFTVTIDVTAGAPGNINNVASVTVTNPPESSSNGQRTAINPLLAPPGSPTRLTTRFTSQLELPPGDGSTKTQVVLNGARTDTTDNSQPFLHEVPGRTGENTVDATLLSAPAGDGLWRFDFRNAPHFEASTFIVEVGQIVVQQPRQLVFRVTSGVRRVRFKYRLSSEP